MTPAAAEASAGFDEDAKNTSLGGAQCLVCYSDLQHPAKTSCGHNDICGVCHLRLRHLHSDKACPMCKHVNDKLIVDEFDTAKPFEEYPMWGNELGGDFVFREDVGMFFVKDHYEREILPLFGFHCTSCNDLDATVSDTTDEPSAAAAAAAPMTNNNNKKSSSAKVTPLRRLQDHLRNKHRQTLCQLCIDFKRDFVARLPRFSPTQLKHHLQHGDGASSGFSGHPLCEFCRPKRFYDLTQLHLHLQKDHYKCHVCDKQGLANQYFRNYNTLESHFENMHFLCRDPQCLAARFVVFENDLDLRHHNMAVHGSSGGSTKIQLEFRVRREGFDQSYENQSVPSDQDFGFGLDGQAFVPEALPQPREPTPETAHPLHLQRTAELRAQAQEMRQQLEMEHAVEAFPTLGQSTQQSEGQIRMGWTSGGVASRVARKPGVQASSEEQFPSLPSSTKSNAKKKIKAGAVSGSRQFATMASAANIVAPTNWNQAVTAPPTTNTARLPVSASFITPAAAAELNSRSNLASENFPSLGGPSSSAPKPYKAAQQLAVKKQAPVMNAMNFPPPPTSSVNNSVRQKVLGDTKPLPKPPSMNHLNFPAPPLSSSGSVTVEKIKAKLGPSKYKELKNLTREFSVDAIAPDAYVDHAASLFENGYGDSDFWALVPSLLMSCPNGSSANQAIRYMDNLRATCQTTIAKVSTPVGWQAPASVKAAPKSTTMAPSTAAASTPVWQAPPATGVRPVGNATASISRNSSHFPLGGKKPPVSAWGANGGGASSALIIASAKGSVAVAAANQGPSSGTATKSMAKETKLMKQAAHAAPATPKNGTKKKKKNELRDLAFGR